MDDDWASSMTAASQIGPAVLVPKRTGILPFLYTTDEVEWGPRAMRVFSGGHIEAFLGCTEEDVIESVVIADGRSPGASGIMLVAVPSRLIETAINLADILPVHHIVALQHLHAHEMEV